MDDRGEGAVPVGAVPEDAPLEDRSPEARLAEAADRWERLEEALRATAPRRLDVRELAEAVLEELPELMRLRGLR